jgi:hypothetical protein
VHLGAATQRVAANGERRGDCSMSVAMAHGSETASATTLEKGASSGGARC